MAITHVGAATVHVTDMDRALDYYTRVLGLVLHKDTAAEGHPGPRTLWIGFAEGRAILVLAGRPPGWPEGPGGFTGIILDVDDAERTYEELQERGAIFSRPLRRGPHAWQAILADPDGNEFLLYQPHDEKDRH